MKTADCVFVLPWKERWIAYFPLRKLAFPCDEDVLAFLRCVDESGPAPRTAKEREVCQLLERSRVLEAKPPVPTLINADLHRPIGLGISTTANCNLRCVYCYSSGGDEGQVIPFHVAKAAIDFAASNALAKKTKTLSLWFYGGGEPTLPWSKLMECVEYAKGTAQQNNLKPHLTIASNGIMNEQQAEWLARNMNAIQFSWDGPPDVQDGQRPTANAKGSFDTLYRSMRVIKACGQSYVLRSTITAWSAPRMTEMVEFAAEKLKPKSLQFEPMKVCGPGFTPIASKA